MADGVLRNTSIQYLHPRLKCPVVLKCNLMREKKIGNFLELLQIECNEALLNHKAVKY